jgi:hypothetical protein
MEVTTEPIKDEALLKADLIKQIWNVYDEVHKLDNDSNSTRAKVKVLLAEAVTLIRKFEAEKASEAI